MHDASEELQEDEPNRARRVQETGTEKPAHASASRSNRASTRLEQQEAVWVRMRRRSWGSS
eukprot:4649785-Amphidinium_carterae.1